MLNERKSAENNVRSLAGLITLPISDGLFATKVTLNPDALYSFDGYFVWAFSTGYLYF